MFHTPLEQHFSDFCLMRAVPCDRFLCLHVILPSPQTQTIVSPDSHPDNDGVAIWPCPIQDISPSKPTI